MIHDLQGCCSIDQLAISREAHYGSRDVLTNVHHAGSAIERYVTACVEVAASGAEKGAEDDHAQEFGLGIARLDIGAADTHIGAPNQTALVLDDGRRFREEVRPRKWLPKWLPKVHAARRDDENARVSE